MLDEQPVGAFAPRSIMAHPHQHPAPPESFSMERKFELAAGERLLGRRIAFGLPIAAIPQLNGAAAIFSLWNRSFEVAIVERVILDFHREPLVAGIERRFLGHGPGLEYGIELEPKVVVQPGSVMFLNDKPKALR